MAQFSNCASPGAPPPSFARALPHATPKFPVWSCHPARGPAPAFCGRADACSSPAFRARRCPEFEPAGISICPLSASCKPGPGFALERGPARQLGDLAFAPALGPLPSANHHYTPAPFDPEFVRPDCKITADEIQRLYKRFMKLDKDGSGSIDKDEFLAIPQIANNPLAPRMIAIFDEDGGGDVDFKEFIAGLSAFSAKGNKEEKLRCKGAKVR
ncbi:MAG: hypothetical protein BJ554DRAFT_7750 [Olpidium bornovanus]|uniref:Calcineurin subunit B n=1 Tax=Olpidium bornovanus TaxID=278681 RepID=A0A8H8DML5_9FUNG|nr:MAG: hypothetical protein BJ554DRAFT_7750 [Olpidium bornovanus]